MKNATPYVELKYAAKPGGYRDSIDTGSMRVFHTGSNEVTFVNPDSGRKTTLFLDKLIALVGAAASLPVGQTES